MKRNSNFSVKADIVVNQLKKMQKVINENSEKIISLKKS